MPESYWRESLSVGVTSFDDDHRTFFHYLSRIEDFMARNAWDETRQLALEFKAFARSHDLLEEKFLRLNGYPHMAAIIDAQIALQTHLDRFIAAIGPAQDGVSVIAEQIRHELLVYLLRGDINYKSFVEILRDTGKLKELVGAQAND